MVIIRKMLFPILRKYLRLFISMVLTASLGLGLLIGLLGVVANLRGRLSNFLVEYGYPDATITTTETKADISYLKDLDCVSDYTVRSYSDCSIVLEDRRITTRVYTYDKDSFLQFYFWEKLDEPGVYVDTLFATDNDLKLGDEIELKYYTLKYNVKITGIISNTSSFSVKQNRYIQSESPDFGYMYVDEDLVDVRKYGFYSQILLKRDTNYSADEMLSQVLDNLPAKMRVIESYTYAKSIPGRSVKMNLSGIDGLVSIAPPAFYAIVLMIIFLFMVQIIGQERKNIGIFKALGYSNKEIVPVYFVIATILSLISLFIGIGIGYGIEYLIMRIYAKSFSIPFEIPKLYVSQIIVLYAINLGVFLLATLFSVLPVLKIEPKEAMNTQGATLATPKLMSKAKLPTSLKLTLSSMLRNYRRFILSSLCIAGSIIMLCASAFMYNAGTVIKHQTFDLRFKYDAICYYSSNLTKTVKSRWDEAESVKCYQIVDIAFPTIEVNGSETTLTIFSLPSSQFMGIVDQTGKKTIDVPKEGIILDYKLAKSMKVKKGDTIKIGTKDVLISDISNQYISAVSYMNPDDFSELNLVSVQAVLCDIKDKTEFIDFVSTTSKYSSTEFKVNIENYISSCLNNVYIGVYVLLVFSVLLGFIVIFNILQINLTEAKREIAIMKSIGVRQSYISATWLLDSLLQYILSLVVGLPLGAVLSKVALGVIETPEWIYPFSQSIYVYLFAAGLAIAYIVISHYASMLGIRKWNLAELTKSKE